MGYHTWPSHVTFTFLKWFYDLFFMLGPVKNAGCWSAWEAGLLVEQLH